MSPEGGANSTSYHGKDGFLSCAHPHRAAGSCELIWRAGTYIPASQREVYLDPGLAHLAGGT